LKTGSIKNLATVSGNTVEDESTEFDNNRVSIQIMYHYFIGVRRLLID
jgi:hypothetical protein